jgi:tape measure domain-containing protein
MLIQLGVDTTELNAGMDRATRSVNKFSQDVAAAGRSLSVGFSIPLLAAGAAALKASADMESLTKGLTSITGSADKTNEQLIRLKEVAKLPGLGFQEAVRGSINLQAAGLNAQLAEKALKSFGNALATVGKGKAELDGVILALTQIAAKGKVSAEEINQLQERLPQIRKAMKDAFGTADTEVLKKMGIDSQQFIEKITAEFAKLPPVTSGLNNSFENLRDSAFQALAKIGDVLRPFAQDFIDNRFGPMTDKVKGLAEAFAKLPDPIKSTTLALTGLAVVLPLVTWGIGTWVASLLKVVGAAEKVALFVRPLLPLLKGLAIPAAVGAAIYYAGNKLLEFADKSDTTAKAVDNLNKKFREMPAKLLSHAGAANMPSQAGLITDAALDFTGGKPAPKPTPTGGGAGGSGSFLVRASVEADLLRQSIDRAKQAVMDFYGAGAEGGKKLDYVVSSSRDHVLDFNVLVEASGANLVKMAEVPAKTFEEALSPAIRNTEAAMHSLGLVSLREMRAAYDAALATAEAMVIAGASVYDVSVVMEKVAELHKKIAERTGAWSAMGKGIEGARKEVNEFQRQIDRTFNRLARGIADSIINWKGFGATLKDIAKDTASSFLEIMIRQLIKPLEDQFAKLAGALGKALGIGGSAASGAASAAGGAASAGGGIASGAGGAASAGASGIIGTIGAVGAAVGAVSSVIGNFQMHGMNKSLDLLVNHSLRQFNVAAQTLDFLYTWNAQWFARTSDMWNEIRNVVAAVKEGGTGGGRGGLTFNNCNFSGSPNEIASAIFTQAQLAGAI